MFWWCFTTMTMYIVHCTSAIGSVQPAVSNQILRGSHLLPSQLPGEHTGVLPHMAHSPS